MRLRRDANTPLLRDVVLEVMTDEWQSGRDVVTAVRMKRRANEPAIWNQLRLLSKAGKIERRGERPSTEYRKVQVQG